MPGIYTCPEKTHLLEVGQGEHSPGQPHPECQALGAVARPVFSGKTGSADELSTGTSANLSES